ncbi:MAG: DUF1272 domain-containing protein [Chromatiales bacterium]|nr:DUF1272 domain-containing protein [Chromatiales bacterium]
MRSRTAAVSAALAPGRRAGASASSTEQDRGNPMLELRPSCEHCNGLAARFNRGPHLQLRVHLVASCVDTVLANVCPNCGGGFVPRPVRPSRNWNGDS